jgi:predicted anti-sigma-YlaC factor YlaD
MTGDPKNMTCQEFQAQLADLIGSGIDVSNHPHLQTCDTCRALLAELETIAEAARQLLPIEQPKEDLWDRIELAIKKEEGSVQPD